MKKIITWWRSHFFSIGKYEALICAKQNRWGAGIINRGEFDEAYLIFVVLPIYSWEHAWHIDTWSWHRKVLFLHGRDGFYSRWQFIDDEFQA